MATVINGNTGVDKVQDGSIHEADINADVARLGVGQTWQDVTASRTSGVTYTNSTGKPIMVSAYGPATAINGNVAGAIDGVIIDYGAQVANTCHSSVLFLVPNGSTYRVDFTAVSKESWKELR